MPLNQVASSHSGEHSRELSPWWILEVLLLGRKFLFGSVMGGASVMLCIALALPKKYEVVGLVSVPQAPGLKESTLVPPFRTSPISELIQIVQQGSFADLLSSRVGTPVTVRGTHPGGTDILRISVTSSDVKTSEAGLRHAFQLISDQHNTRLESFINNISVTLAVVDREVAWVESQMDRYLALEKDRGSGVGTRDQDLFALILSNRADIRNKRLAISLALDTAKNNRLSLIGDIDINKNPIFPNLRLFGLVGGLVGLLGGVLYIIVRSRLSNQR